MQVYFRQEIPRGRETKRRHSEGSPAEAAHVAGTCGGTVGSTLCRVIGDELPAPDRPARMAAKIRDLRVGLDRA